MKTKKEHYESPSLELVEAIVSYPIAQSNLESPQDGGEWEWD